MEKNDKGHDTSKKHSNLVIKILLVVLCVVVVVQFAVIAKGYATLSNRLNTLEDKASLGIKSVRSQKDDDGPRRNKRETVETDIKKALTKLEELEGR